MGSETHRRTPEAGAGRDIQKAAHVLMQALQIRIKQSHDLVEWPELAIVHMARERQTNATMGSYVESCRLMVHEDRKGR